MAVFVKQSTATCPVRPCFGPYTSSLLPCMHVHVHEARRLPPEMPYRCAHRQAELANGEAQFPGLAALPGRMLAKVRFWVHTCAHQWHSAWCAVTQQERTLAPSLASARLCRSSSRAHTAASAARAGPSGAGRAAPP